MVSRLLFYKDDVLIEEAIINQDKNQKINILNAIESRKDLDFRLAVIDDGGQFSGEAYQFVHKIHNSNLSHGKKH